MVQSSWSYIIRRCVLCTQGYWPEVCLWWSSYARCCLVYGFLLGRVCLVLVASGELRLTTYGRQSCMPIPWPNHWTRKRFVFIATLWWTCGDFMHWFVSVIMSQGRGREATEAVVCLRARKPLHNGSYEHRVPKIKIRKKHDSVPGTVCVNQHRNWPLRSTILNAHGTHASPDGLCTRTHTNDAFSCWFCCNSFSVDRARRGDVCLEDHAKACSPTDQPVRKFKDSSGISMIIKTFSTFRTEWYFRTRTAVQSWRGVSAAWCS